MKKEYLSQQFDIYSPESSRSFNELSYWSSLFGQMIIDHMPLKPNQQVLDLACATGFPLFELAERLGPSSHFTGVDIWENALEVARSTLKARQLDNVTLLRADAACLQFPDQHFDLITCNLGINNFDDPKTVLAECFRVLKTSGNVLLTSNLTGHMQEFFDIFAECLSDSALLVTAKCDHNDGPDLLNHINHRGDEESLSALLRQAGFEITRTERQTFRYRYLNGTAFLNSYFIKACFLPSWREIVPSKDEDQFFQQLETRLNQVASDNGELSLTIPGIYLELSAKN